MNKSRTRLISLSTVVIAALIAPVAPLAQGATTASGDSARSQPSATAQPYQLKDGVTSPVYSYADAIRESVWVLAPDLDRNGQRDRVAVDIIRPAELAGTASKVPVIMDASPYYACCGRGNESELKEYDADGNPTKFPLFYDNFFVPRGYAYAAVDMAGTNRSTGCVDQGAESDIQSVRAVVDWMNGRASAVDADGNPVSAGWTNGKVGMIGKSYDGTLANGVAATGVRGLETIVPVSAISSWYDYDRYQGLPFSYDYPTWLSSVVAEGRTEPVDCSAINDQMAAEDGDETGAYSPFWSRRDYRDRPNPDASNVRASVFITHGLQDTNVKGANFSRWWRDLGRSGVDRKMWLSRLGHVDPFDHDRARWVETLHKWFDSELMGIHNDILREPRVDVEVSPNQWVKSDQWPLKSKPTDLHPKADGSLTTGRHHGAPNDKATFVNDPNQGETQAVTEGPNPSRLLFTTAPLAHNFRIGGTTALKLQVTTEVLTGQVGVMLVDYGVAQRVLRTGDGAQTLTTESCYGASVAYDDPCYRDVTRRIGATPLQVLARGWSRLDRAGSHRVTVELTPDDSIVQSGHRLGLVIVGASPNWLETVDSSRSTYTVDLHKTELVLPSRVDFGPASPSAARNLGDVPTRSELVKGALPTIRSGPQIPR